MRCAAHTLGCKLNFAETSHLLRRLTAYGHQIVDFDDEADLYIINTCTVTAIAEKKCRTIIRQAIRRNPGAQVAVIGCFAQNDAASIARIPGVTLILGNDRKHLLPELIANEKVDTEATTPFPLAYSSGDRAASSRYNTAATISAPTAPSRLPGGAATARPSNRCCRLWTR